MYEDRFMKMALDVAREAAGYDEIPVGAVLVKDGQVVAVGANHKERKLNALLHAETVAMAEGSKVLGNWWLDGCELYVTLEPCPMCAGAMINCRISALYFGAYDPKSGAAGSKVDLFEKGLFNHDIQVSGGHMREECGELLSSFFKKKRAEKSGLKGEEGACEEEN